MDINEKNRLDSARKKLYAKKNEIGDLKRIRLKQRKYDVNAEWADEAPVARKEVELLKKPKKKSPMTFYAKFFVFSFVFFLISIIAALFIFNSGANQITYEKVSLGVQGPNYISGGDTISFIVSINNQNSEPIVLSDVYVNYPPGTVEPGSPTIPMLRDRESFEQILPGETKEVKFKAVIFGSEGDTKKIQIRYEYRVENSNAIYHKEKDYDIRVSTAPVNVSVEHTNKVLSGEEIELEVDITSNSTEDVSNLGLKIDYPFGFVFGSALPEPVSGDNIWDIGTILSAGSKTILVKGVISGQNQEERVFRYSVGSKDEDNLTDIGAIFSSTESVVSIKKPDLGVKIIANGSLENIDVGSGETVSVKLEITNNLISKVINPNVEVLLKGEAFDEKTVEVDSGFYNSSSNKIIWSKQTTEGFNEIENGQTSKFSFRFKIKDNLAGQVKNPELEFVVSAVGETFGSDGNERGVNGRAERMVKINSDIFVTGKTYHAEGPIENSGPIPPVVGELTTYTIMWETKSTTNEFTNTTVSALLPPYVLYQGVFTPSTENIFFDEKTKQVVWNVGKVAAFSGYTSESEKVYFKVALDPSVSQVGSPVILLNEKKITAVDTFTEKTIVKTGEAETSTLSDASAPPNSGMVVEE